MTGLIRGQDGEPLPNATVLVRNESTGFQSGTVTNLDGRYLFRQLPLGRPYTVIVSFVGYDDQRRTGFALNLGDQLAVDFNLAETNTALEAVTVTGSSLKSRIDRLGATTAITANEITRLPVLNRDFNSLAALSPLTNGSNIGSQRFSSTNFLIDGVSARNNLTSGDLGSGPYTVSLEAIREFEVAANEYDVSQGWQGGGTISVVTKSGTNTFTVSAFTYYNADWLASPRDIRGNARTAEFNRYQYGFSLGGPIIKDKLHFFVALDRQNESERFFVADIRNENDESALNIRQDTLNKFLSVARDVYGLSGSQQVGQFTRRTVANTFFSRLDWQLNAKHRLTLRNNYSDWNNPASTNDNNNQGVNISLFESYSDFHSRENSTLLSLRSAFKPTLVNGLKVQWQHSEREYRPSSQLPQANIPRATVTVRSPFPTESNSNATRNAVLQIGGQRFTPEQNFENQLQLVNTTYLSAGRYNFTFGTDNTLTYLYTYISNEQNGRFYFNSLQDFQNQRASRFARQVPTKGLPDVEQYVLNTSLFGQVQVNPHPHLSSQFGMRWDLTSYLTQAAYNPVVEQELGLRTDARISDWDNIQPRLQLTWDVGGKRRDIVRVGAGVFSAYVINYAQVNNIQNSGSNVAEVDVSGAAVPRPDLLAYRNDPASAPGVPEGAPSVSTINLNDPNFEVPTIYKANLTYNRFVGDWLRIGVNFLWSRTVNNYVYLDRNLVDEPFFTLANEGNRGVFVPAGTIAANGQTNNLNGRKSQLVGRTLEFTNRATLKTATLVLDAEMRLPRNGNLNVSYTLNDARDNTSYNGNVANTSTFRPIKSDPRDLSEFNYSDNHFRHKVAIYGVSPTVAGFVFSARFTRIGGTRFSTLVEGTRDINGDFVASNDLAFVFDPNSLETPENVRDGINDILIDPETREGYKEYLRISFGRIADRNGGENPFNGTVDVRFSKIFKTFGSQSLELSVDVFNFANLLNKDWGGNYNLGNRNLLDVTGFDQAAGQYRHNVLGNAGQI